MRSSEAEELKADLETAKGRTLEWNANDKERQQKFNSMVKEVAYVLGVTEQETFEMISGEQMAVSGCLYK